MVEYKNVKWIGLIELGFIPNDDFVLMENDTGTWIEEWHSSDAQPTDAELQTAYDSVEYKRQRKAEYPSIEECVHAMLDDGLVELQEKRAAVKAKYPKGGSA
mgnify:CR=1 FL=1|tara:strand:+ start:189 stop:494 length:306 start_codon:yes stop_codon:yes gene_type:complete